jgi:hypothetical protein
MTGRARWRWLPVLAGALVVSLALRPVGSVAFYFTPLVLGVTYLAAAAVVGRRATMWAPGFIITFWGIGVALEFSKTVHADFPSVAVTALGAGATVAALVGRVGIRTEPLAIALSVLLAGVTELVDSKGVDVLGRGWFYGALLGAWIVFDLLKLSPLLRSRGREPSATAAT